MEVDKMEKAVQAAVRSISRRKNFGAISEEDLFQEGMVFALQRMDNYDKNCASIMTFLFRPVKTHLNRILQREVQASGLIIPDEQQDNEDNIGSTIFPDQEQAFSYEVDVDLQLDMGALLSTLSDDEKFIVTERFVNNVKLKKLAAHYSISEPAMHHRITNIIDKLKCRLGSKYGADRN